jgi:hypothetical protein
MEWIVKLSGKNAEELAKKVVEELTPYKKYLHTIIRQPDKSVP